MSPRIENCQTCRFLDGLLCRRYAPRAFPADRTDDVVFPRVVPDVDWCGEWVPRSPREALAKALEQQDPK